LLFENIHYFLLLLAGKNGSPHEPVDQQCNVSNLKLIFHFSIFSKNQTKPKKKKKKTGEFFF